MPTRSEWDKILENDVRQMEARLEAEAKAKAERKERTKKKVASAFFFVLGVVVTELIHLLFEFLH